MEITKIKNQEKNEYRIMRSDDLITTWNFTTGKKSGDYLITDSEVKNVENRQWYDIPPADVKRIFSVAEKYEVAEAKDALYNFIVLETGKLKIGFHMKTIKENLEELQKAFLNFENREFYNVIEFSD